MFPLCIIPNLKDVFSHAHTTMNPQVEGKVAAITKIIFQAEIKDESWL